MDLCSTLACIGGSYTGCTLREEGAWSHRRVYCAPAPTPPASPAPISPAAPLLPLAPPLVRWPPPSTPPPPPSPSSPPPLPPPPPPPVAPEPLAPLGLSGLASSASAGLSSLGELSTLWCPPSELADDLDAQRVHASSRRAYLLLCLAALVGPISFSTSLPSILTFHPYAHPYAHAHAQPYPHPARRCSLARCPLRPSSHRVAQRLALPSTAHRAVSSFTFTPPPPAHTAHRRSLLVRLRVAPLPSPSLSPPPRPCPQPPSLSLTLALTLAFTHTLAFTPVFRLRSSIARLRSDLASSDDACNDQSPSNPSKDQPSSNACDQHAPHATRTCDQILTLSPPIGATDDGIEPSTYSSTMREPATDGGGGAGPCPPCSNGGARAALPHGATVHQLTPTLSTPLTTFALNVTPLGTGPLLGSSNYRYLMAPPLAAAQPAPLEQRSAQLLG